MHKILFFWGNQRVETDDAVLELIESSIINPPKMIHTGNKWLLIEELPQFKSAGLNKRQGFNSKIRKEAKILAFLYLCFFIFSLFDANIDMTIYVLAFASMILGVQLCNYNVGNKVIQKIAKHDLDFIESYRTYTAIESQQSYIQFLLMPILVLCSLDVFFTQELLSSAFLTALFKHNSLLHWFTNIIGLIWCLKFIEGRFKLFKTAAILTFITVSHYFLYTNIHLSHGNGLSSIVCALLVLVMFICYQTRCYLKFKEYLVSVLIILISSLPILDYIDTLGHIYGLIIGAITTLLIITLENGHPCHFHLQHKKKQKQNR